MSHSISELQVPGFIKEELRLRAIRDRVFESVSSDANWNACKHRWMTLDSIQWLERWDAKLKLKAITM